MVIPSLAKGGYSVRKSVNVGRRLGDGKHVVDVIASDSAGRVLLVSLKWQQTSGTTEQKVPFEIMSLADAIRSSAGRYHKAYLVLGGPGWKLRDFFVADGVGPFMKNVETVVVMRLEEFIGKANKGQL